MFPFIPVSISCLSSNPETSMTRRPRRVFFLSSSSSGSIYPFNTITPCYFLLAPILALSLLTQPQNIIILSKQINPKRITNTRFLLAKNLREKLKFPRDSSPLLPTFESKSSLESPFLLIAISRHWRHRCVAINHLGIATQIPFPKTGT